ncbi:hypothetical protein U9M48_001674 [Paspalum notatum var. saurae]|uniref:Uncharacterized protein n=1 Tax=Paspalum notatum var. saurae TaxID=547442 RepID=A0AAQ3PP01_PASNO
MFNPLSRRSIAPWRHADATHNTTPSPNPAEAECLSRSEAEHLRLWAVGDRRRRDLDVLHLAADRQCQGVQTAEPTHLRSAVQHLLVAQIHKKVTLLQLEMKKDLILNEMKPNTS